jgi:hypothetical protein
VSSSSYDSSYDEFRNELLSVFNATLAETKGMAANRAKYLIDLRIGLRLYQLMPLGKNFSVIQANDDDLWRYISVKVMPDITYIRNPDPDQDIGRDRRTAGTGRARRFDPLSSHPPYGKAPS